MRTLALVCTTIALAGCVEGNPDVLALRATPGSGSIWIDLASGPPAPIAFTVTGIDEDGGERDLTLRADFELVGPPLGWFAGATFHSDGIAGTADVRITVRGVDDVFTTVPLTATVTSTRIPPGVPDDVLARFEAAAPEPAIGAALRPADGAIVPSGLAALDVAFSGDAPADLHELRVTAPLLDVRVYDAGVPQLTSDEWSAIRRSVRGGGFELTVRSLASSARARVSVADRALDGALLYDAAPATDDAGVMSGLWRHDLTRGATAPWFVQADRGEDVGGDAAGSHDGARLAVQTTVRGTPGGVIVDAVSHEPLSQPVAWDAAVFDPGGRLVTAFEGTLTLRDGISAEAIATLVTAGPASDPTISDDGDWLAYATTDALVVHTFNAFTAELGPPTIIAAPGARLPSFSPEDGDWLLYTTSAGFAVVRADGSAPPVALSADPRDTLARWITAPTPMTIEGKVERVAWLVFASTRADGVTPQLWLTALFPDRITTGGAVTAPPIHLPGQPPDLAARHAALRRTER